MIGWRACGFFSLSVNKTAISLRTSRSYQAMTSNSNSSTRTTQPFPDAPPSKHMRLGAGLSSVAKSPVVSCFDELYADNDLSDQRAFSESDLMDLFGLSSAEKECTK
jgi:hypothetical protein